MKEAPKKVEVPKKAVQKLTWKEERELEGMEDKVMELDEQVSSLEEEMNSPEFYQQDHHVIQEKTDELEKLRAELDHTYARWEELDAKKTS